jgi:hypothetical protein
VGNRCSQANKRNRLDEVTGVQMAVAAVTGDSNLMDTPMTEIDPSPAALDLPKVEQPCSRCDRPTEGRCPACGSPLCGDCAAGDEG